MADTVTRGTPLVEVPGRSDPPKPGRVRPFPKWALVGFLVLLNLVAMYGQAAWFRVNVTNNNGPEDWVPAIGIALVIELIGVYLAGMAHAALMADQSAGMLRTGSYLVGVLAGTLNFAHFADPHGDGLLDRVTPAAITFGALSAISPWLWSIYSRHVNRERLTDLGLVDPRGVRLGINRKVWHPIKSLRVVRWAAWETTDRPMSPGEAIRKWEQSQTGTVPEPELPEPEPHPVEEIESEWLPEAPVSPAPGRTPEEWVAMADGLREQHPTLTWTDVAKLLGISDRHLRNCRRAVATTTQSD